MKEKFEEFIINRVNCADFSGKADNLVIFCHFDAANIISDHVVYYLSELQKADCDIILVTNSNIDQKQVSKVKDICNQIIIRQNKGYDFAAYFTGYLEHRDMFSNYSHVLFVNDSVFGPFYSLDKVFKKMSDKDLDMWGISDAFHKHYHIQSYFWAFKTSDEVLQVLDLEAANFDFELPKKHVVQKYEEGITAKILEQELKIGVLCSNAEAIDFEMNNRDDEFLQELKGDMLKIARSKQSFMKKIRSLFSVKANRSYNFNVPDANAYLTGINSCWYSMIKYFECPFIKVSLLKSSGNFRYHGFKFIGLLKEKYPEYDWTMIENHLKRNWKC